MVEHHCHSSLIELESTDYHATSALLPSIGNTHFWVQVYAKSSRLYFELCPIVEWNVFLLFGIAVAVTRMLVLHPLNLDTN